MQEILNEIEQIENAKNSMITSVINKGIEVPSNTKLDEISTYIGQIEDVKEITFNVDNYMFSTSVVCTAREGMTFGSWLYSDYCTDDVKQQLNQPMIDSDNYCLMDFDEYYLYDESDSNIFASTVIEKGMYYYFGRQGVQEW